VDHVTLIECAAAPSLFYADWVHPIANEFPRLARWRAHLLALPPVQRCVDDARPYRGNFPPGAPDRDEKHRRRFVTNDAVTSDFVPAGRSWSASGESPPSMAW
jgi:hypothetical protein